jgi:hypothetical protein
VGDPTVLSVSWGIGLQRRILRWLNNELLRKDLGRKFRGIFEILSRYGEPTKNLDQIVGAQAEIRTGYLPNKVRTRYRFSQLSLWFLIPTDWFWCKDLTQTGLWSWCNGLERKWSGLFGNTVLTPGEGPRKHTWYFELNVSSNFTS